MTYSIVARDPETGDLGIAVQSKFPAVGSLVPWLKIGAGAIATQAHANLTYGSQGLKLLSTENTASQVLKILLNGDSERDHRQVGIVDHSGNVAAHTGSKCFDWAGHLVGDQVTCQGNILIESTVDAMMDTYLKTKGDLPEKLMSAIEAGQAAGGDSRGQQSANLIVYRKNGGYGGGSDTWIDVRVDDHPMAVEELRRVFKLYSITLLEREDPDDITNLTGSVMKEIEIALMKGFYLKKSDNTNEEILNALETWFGIENFENKFRTDGLIWNSVLNFLLEK